MPQLPIVSGWYGLVLLSPASHSANTKYAGPTDLHARSPRETQAGGFEHERTGAGCAVPCDAQGRQSLQTAESGPAHSSRTAIRVQSPDPNPRENNGCRNPHQARCVGVEEFDRVDAAINVRGDHPDGLIFSASGPTADGWLKDKLGSYSAGL